MTTTGADMISARIPRALDPLCFLLDGIRSLNATATTVFLTVQYARESESKTEPVER